MKQEVWQTLQTGSRRIGKISSKNALGVDFSFQMISKTKYFQM